MARRRSIGSVTQSLLRGFGLDVRRVGAAHDWSDPRNYIPLEATLVEAAALGLTVGEFVDQKHNVRGATAGTMDRLGELGVFAGRIDRVCEIGPGSGRYLELTIARCHPTSYEIYETASDWAEWLVRTYKVSLRPTDGKSLSATESRSIDLVQAHKVFPVTPTVTTCGYLREMARVVAPGGKVVFDVMTEQCFDDPTLDRWIGSMSSRPHGSYPAIMPRQFVVEYLGRRGLLPLGSFIVTNAPGLTECMAFVRPV